MHAKLARFATTPGGFLAFTRTEYETDTREVARTIHVPAAVLVKERAGPSWGSYGAAQGHPATGSPAGATQADLSMRAVAEYNASLIPGARLVTVPGAAAIPFFDQEEAYADAMIAFLESVQARGGRPRPHARHRPLHGHRRLDRQGVRRSATPAGRSSLSGTTR